MLADHSGEIAESQNSPRITSIVTMAAYPDDHEPR